MALKWTREQSGDYTTSDGFGVLRVNHSRKAKKWFLFRDTFGSPAMLIGSYDSRFEAQKAAEPKLREINPKHKDVDKALKLYKEFREAPPRRGRSVEFELPKSVMVMGNLISVLYDTTRQGMTEKYKHDFAPGSRPLLCADGKNGQLFILEGRYHVTERGIVDLDARGNEIED